jgi:hypothetical protein
VTGTVTTKVQDKVAFLVEAHQAGIFDIRNVPAEQLDPLLGIACPTILYPYLRGNIADVITRAGFQAIHLSEINFQALVRATPASRDGRSARPGWRPASCCRTAARPATDRNFGSAVCQTGLRPRLVFLKSTGVARPVHTVFMTAQFAELP